jgi:phenylacetate-CoA ligase
MECWSFPPEYDDACLPRRSDRYWFPVRETMDAGERDAAIAARIRDVMRYARERSAFYRKKWDDAGIDIDAIRTLEDFERVPVVTKAELRADQEAYPPFGSYLCASPDEVHHIHGTSGTTGRPTAFAIGRGDWRAIANAHARIMWAMGLRPGDTIFIASIFSLYMGSWGSMLGAERLGARVFPFGAGAPGMTSRAVMWLASIKPLGFYSTPSYALHLAETARAEGVEPRDFGLGVMFFSGEPGASIPGIRTRIEDAFGARVIDCGSMAEMTPWMNIAGSAETDGMLLWQDLVYTEVCDPASLAAGGARRVPYGAEGTPVYTHLERTSQPMIRLLSGDLTRWTSDANPCGRTYPRLPRGIYGRIDDMFQIRGENVYPSAIEDVLGALAGYGGEHRIVITRTGAMDELLVRVEVDAGTHAAGAEALAQFGRIARERLSRALGVRANVEACIPGTFPRTDFKARRVIDDRDLFRELSGKLTRAD